MKTIVRICFFFTLSMSFAQNNLLDSSTWTVGTGSAPGFTRTGTDAENIREIGVGPHGASVLLWKAITDGSIDNDGGWKADTDIDPSKTYRFTVWVKKMNSNDGNVYFGISSRDGSNGWALYNLQGVQQTYTSFFSGDLSELDKWYLLVGYVHNSSYGSTTSLGGIYDDAGTKLVDLIDRKFQPDAVKVVSWPMMELGGNTADSQFFYDPTIYEVNGQEPTIQDLIDGPLDSQAPTAPTLSSTVQTDTTVDLSWSGAADNIAVTGYKIFKDGVLESTLGNFLTYQVTGLTASTSYNFTVTALDAAGNESVVSNTLAITTNAASGDTQAPTAPTLSSTVQTETTVDLSWTAATDNTAVTGYRVYKDAVLEATLGNVLTSQVTSLTASTGYNFTVTALDAAGNESVASNTLAITTDAAPGGGSGNWTLSNQNVYYNIGNVGIGTSTPDEKLTVKGAIHSEEVKVDLSVPAPDYVFESDYNLTPLEKLSLYIKENKHLPNIPKGTEMEANGVELGIMNMKLLEKIEELTLYILQQQKDLNTQTRKNIKLENRIIRLEILMENKKNKD